jgi:dolichyl-phosphate-mannose-protein mannosyltransferase
VAEERSVPRRGSRPAAPSAPEIEPNIRDDDALREPELTRPANAPARTLRVQVEDLAWPVVIAIAALTRLPALAILPLSLSDSARAYSAWQVAAGRQPQIWSGDFVQTLTAAIFKFGGAGDARARATSAVLGIILVGALWLYRPLIGRAPALLAAILVALSPICVAVSRSVSGYSAGIVFVVLLAALILDFVERPRPAPLAWIAGLLGFGFSTDASFLVFLLTALLFCLIEGFWLHREELTAAGTFLRDHQGVLRSSALIALSGLLLSTTRFGIATDRLRSGSTLSWSQAFNPPAFAPPWHFPIDALLAYEPIVFLAGIAAALYLAIHARRAPISIVERFLLYWAAAALLFSLVVSRQEAGQLPLAIVPLTILAAIAAVRCLGRVRWGLLQQTIAPSLLAFPAFVYVLFVLESTTANTQLSAGQTVSLAFLFLGGLGLIAIAAYWARDAAPAYLTICGLVLATIFALHTTSRVGFALGDEFLLGSVATPQAPALGADLAGIAPNLSGVISVDPALASPLAWYSRGNTLVRFQTPSPAAAVIVQPVDAPQVPGYTAYIAQSETGRAWYPGRIDPSGVMRWLLYRQAWQQVRTTRVQVLVKAEQP